ncbi:MAG: beta strand repeat-containing protein, partial [Terriglobia bacterium]
AYGVFIANTATTGTITNRYDLYASSANGKSYFAGNVGIGTTIPTAKLEVNGTAKFDSGVTVTGLAAGNCVQAGTGGLLTTTASPCGSGGGGGTISGVTAGTDLTGGGTSGMVTLNLDTTKVPQLGTPNTFAATQTIGSGDVSVSNGNLDLPNTTAATAGVINLGGSAFLHQCCNTNSGYTNTFVGLLAGNFSSTGGHNTASGYGALLLNGTGTDNTASGALALDLNSTGNYNTATGDHALYSNETGSNNTASGAGALYVNVGGSGNTAVGFNAGTDLHRSFPTSGSNSTFVGASANATVDNLTNATAIGYNAQVGESNALVLGNGAMVGIGTSTPQYALDVHGTGNFTGAVTVTDLAAGNCVQAGTGGLLTTTASPCGSGGGGGGGTVTSVGSGAGLTGGPITTAGTLSIASGGVTDAMLNNPYAGTGACGAGAFVTSLNRAAGPTCTFGDGRYAQLAAPNTFAATQTIGSGDLSVSNGDLDLPSTTGATVGVINLGGIPFIFGLLTNTFVGLGAGNFSSAEFGGSNTATGYHALSSNTTGFYNTASGYGAMFSNTTGANNTASGLQALYWNTGGNNNTASGVTALYSNTAGYANTASGVNALSGNTMGYSNTASGVAALYGNTMGYQNTATGLEALYWNATGNNNTASGYQALYSNTTGGPNTASGYQALYSNTTSCCNTATGYQALYSSTAEANTAAGSLALHSNTTGAFNTALGANADVGSGDLSNATAIGAGAIVSASNALVLGNGGVNVGIGTSTPAHTLDVVGDIHASGAITGASKNFRIDHPVDPEHKDLYHASIESSEMMDLYTGNAMLDANGEAVVQMPEWFEALNQDFRYQLTAVGAPGPNLYVKEKIRNNRFRIAGGAPGAEVSWQVTGVRHDAWAKAHPLQVEVEKVRAAKTQ